MSEELKALLGSKKKLKSILECSDVHAWRLWTGKTNLSAPNEKLIRLVMAAESK
ncbi:hypothetical protein VP137E351_P0033 [Vibrio phage 137E35-1]|nr:hypothetical protein VP137E351_P0033 [Vibrio phage 137E35-1]CAH9016066.1 hypothetical protein VP230E391_P0033 [Vibrio phage 230E39-1]